MKNKTLKLLCALTLCVCVAGTASAQRHHRHHHGGPSRGLANANAIVNIVANSLAIGQMLGITPVAPAPVVVAPPAPVVVPPPAPVVVAPPAPVVVAQPAPVVVPPPAPVRTITAKRKRVCKAPLCKGSWQPKVD